MRYLWLVFSISFMLIGFVVGRYLKLSPPTAYIVMWVPFFLATYPFMKRWMPKASFYYWLTVAVISSAVWWLLYLGFTRLGG